MHRLFVAIRPPRAMREHLVGMMGGIPGAHWQDDDQLHLTLRFIGEVDARQADDIAAALGAIHHLRFAVALAGVGTFDRKGAVAAIWAGVSPHEPLRTLHNKVDQALRAIGVAPDTRAYLPHITLARLGRASGPVDPMLARSAGLSSPAMEIDAFCLYESSLGREGSVYEIVERYRLG